MLSKGQLPVDFNDNLAAKLATWDNDSMWKQRTIANPAMYDDIRGRLEEYLAKSNVKVDASAPAARGPEAEPEAEASAKPVEPAEDSWEATLRNVLAYVLEEQQAKEYAKTVADYASVIGNKVYGEDPATSSSAPQDKRASKRASLRASKRLSKRLSKAFQAPNPADEAPPAILKQPTPRREPLEASSKPAKPQPALEKQPSRMQRIKSSVFGRSKSSKGAGPAGNQQLAAAR
jgi:hypothetical protein